MLEIIRQKIDLAEGREDKIHRLREFLQILCLKLLSDHRDFKQIVFTRGTALRILFNLKRYSEDLDFSLYNNNQYVFKALLKNMEKQFEKMNLEVEIKYKEGLIDSAMLGFVQILQQLDLHVAENQRLSIKLEIDTNPPQGGNLETTLINNEFIFPIKHYSLASLMAGKLHAILCRKFNKGRDYYDLIWYLTQKITPDLDLLNQAILQTERTSLNLNQKNWKSVLSEKIEKLNFVQLKQDVSRFLIQPEEIQLLDKTYFKKLLQT